MIEIKGLRKTYGSHNAVDGIDLVVEDGEVMALLGPSGCGKTTTLQLLAGFLQPDAGTIRVNGRLLSDQHAVVPPERRNMSLIFQSYAVWPHKTVAANVAFGLEVRKVARAEQQERVRKILERVRLDQLADRYPGELSGGQQQRVALARALVVEPEILLLDEPLSNLDANLREEMRFEVRRLHDDTGITMVYVTHDQAEAMVTADRIAVMNLGRVEQVGTPTEIYEEPRTAFTASFIGRTNLLQRNGKTISIRPHQVLLQPPSHGQAEHLTGRVIRHAYLGETRDYLLELPEGTQMRVHAPPHVIHQVGGEVDIYLPIEACRPVER
jgi:iron(III) transport system ATP-binding protein